MGKKCILVSSGLWMDSKSRMVRMRMRRGVGMVSEGIDKEGDMDLSSKRMMIRVGWRRIEGGEVRKERDGIGSQSRLIE